MQLISLILHLKYNHIWLIFYLTTFWNCKSLDNAVTFKKTLKKPLAGVFLVFKCFFLGGRAGFLMPTLVVIAILSCSCLNISQNASWEIQILADKHAAARLARLLTMACLVWAGEKKLHFWGSRILQTYVAAIHSMEEVWNFSLLQTKRRRQVRDRTFGPQKDPHNLRLPRSKVEKPTSFLEP